MPGDAFKEAQRVELNKKIDEAYRAMLAFRGAIDPEMKKWLAEVLEYLYWHGYQDGIYALASDMGADVNRLLRRFDSGDVMLGWVSETHLGRKKVEMLAEDYYKKECGDL